MDVHENKQSRTDTLDSDIDIDVARIMEIKRYSFLKLFGDFDCNNRGV